MALVQGFGLPSPLPPRLPAAMPLASFGPRLDWRAFATNEFAPWLALAWDATYGAARRAEVQCDELWEAHAFLFASDADGERRRATLVVLDTAAHEGGSAHVASATNAAAREFGACAVACVLLLSPGVPEHARVLRRVAAPTDGVQPVLLLQTLAHDGTATAHVLGDAREPVQTTW